MSFPTIKGHFRSCAGNDCCPVDHTPSLRWHQNILTSGIKSVLVLREEKRNVPLVVAKAKPGLDLEQG